MNEVEKKSWLKTKSLKLKVSKEYFHHHSFEIVNTYNELKKNMLASLTCKISISPRIKLTGKFESKAIKAEELNKVIREQLKTFPNNEIKFEVYEENGVFYFSEENNTIGGFDFAILNHYNNILALRNLCFGSLHYSDGEKRWTKFLKKNPDLVEIANSLKRVDEKGTNIGKGTIENSTPLIVGEIQFGNWALAYRDFFKVLKADVQNSVDCLIYIVPTGNLEKLLSDGIVTFDKTKKIMEDFSKVISVPVWLIGIDVE
ncbi:MAG: hypothetical protein JNL95_14035 [Chitinophagales bacterium]|nr:hypothetical protein [Chitinophagales bacterium]